MAWRDPHSSFRVIRGVRWTNDYENTPYFESPAAQREWFEAHTLSSGTLDQIVYSHLGDKALTVRVPTTYRKARAWTYCLIHDSIVEDGEIRDTDTGATFNDRNYFYFITNAKYINNAVTELELELDKMQTFMFDYTIPSAFMERMHVTSDAIGSNITPEAGSTRDTFVRASTRITNVIDSQVYPPHSNTTNGETFTRPNLMVLFTSTEDINHIGDSESYPAPTTRIDGIPTGLGTYAIDPSVTLPAPFSGMQVFDAIIKAANTSGKMGAFEDFWLYPRDLLTLQQVGTSDPITSNTYYVKGVKKTVEMNAPLRPTNFSDMINSNYVPKNNKLFTYPYTFIEVDNYNGDKSTYRYEYADQGILKFSIGGDFSPAATIKAIPLKYKGYSSTDYFEGVSYKNWEECCMGGEFPKLAFNCDNYKMWLAKTTNTREAGFWNTIIDGIQSGIGGLTKMLSSKSTAGVVSGALDTVGGVVDTFQGINNLMAAQDDAKTNTSSKVGAQSTYSNYVMQTDAFGFRIYCKQINSRDAINLDRYFSRFGYAINAERQPYRKQRANWTYLKTAGCSIIPNDYAPSSWQRSCALGTQDIKDINSIYDKGITFWTDPSRIGDYYGYSWDNPTLSSDEIKW